MNYVLPDTSDYKALSARGLLLPETDFKVITAEIKKGVLDCKNYLKTAEAAGPEFTFSDNINALGFSVSTGSINLRIDYLNLFVSSASPLEYKDQLVCFVPDKFYVIVKYFNWLRLFGREETIHYYQHFGNPQLHVKFPEEFPENFSPKSLLLSDLEVEARKVGDTIALTNNESPVWKNIDEYFMSNFPDYYNKPIEELATLPKPNLQISFEMENILT